MQRPSRALARCPLLAFVCFLGCNGALSPQAGQLLSSGYAAYNNGDDQAAVNRMDSFLQANARSRRADEAYYLRGLARYRLKDLPGAKADLDEALGRTQRKDLRARTLLALGDLAYQSDQMALAENMYRRASADLKRGEKASGQAHYQLGVVLQRQGRWNDADLQFDRVIYLFEGSQRAGLAERRVRCVAWTIQVGAFRNKKLADAAAERLRAENLPANVKCLLSGGQPMFMVQVRRYPTYEQAAVALPGLKRHKSDAFVIPTR